MNSRLDGVEEVVNLAEELERLNLANNATS